MPGAVESAYISAYITGQPEAAEILTRTAKRESRLKRIGVHERDQHHSRTVWVKSVKRGWVRKWCQPYRANQWSTRGQHGLMAGYHMRYLPLGGFCMPPSVFDIPLVSAYAAARKLKKACEKERKCTYRNITKYWHGKGYRKKL